MDDDVENLQQGYESRHVVSTIWINSILGLIDAEDNCAKAAVHATLSCSFNAPVLHSVLIRGIHSGLLSICGCLIQALHVPIIPVDELCDFFKSDEVSVFKHGVVQLRVLHG
jgi:hypothetical protein